MKAAYQSSVHFHIADDQLTTDKLNLQVTNLLTAFGLALRQWVFPKSKMHTVTGTHLATVACGHQDKEERCKKLIKVSFVPVGPIRVFSTETDYRVTKAFAFHVTYLNGCHSDTTGNDWTTKMWPVLFQNDRHFLGLWGIEYWSN